MFLSRVSRGLASKSLPSSASISIGRRGAAAAPSATAAARTRRSLCAWGGIVGDDAPTAEDIGNLQDEFRADPESAKFVLESTSKLTTGLRSTATIREKFEIPSDEPGKFGGTDTAPSPVEIILASLGTCQEITYKAYAQAMKIPVLSVSLKIEGDIDMRGFFSVDPNVRPGIQKIRGVATVETPTSVSTQLVEELKAVVDTHCPVSDMLGAVPTEITLEHVQTSTKI